MKKTAYLYSSAMVAGLMSQTAIAQDTTEVTEATPRRLEAIIVSTQKVDENLLDVPINVSAVDQDFIDLINADDFEELADFVPGLQVQAQSLNAPSFSIRGVTSDGGSPRVAIFTNGVSNARPGWAASLAYFDMERIEVVKGPQPTLFGQGALVGGVNFIQNKADTTGTYGYVQAEAGSYNTKRFEGAYNYSVSDDLAVRIAGVHDDYDGYVENHSPSTPDLMGQRTDALRVSAHWQPTSNLTTDLIFNFEDDKSTGTEFRSTVFPTGPSGQETTNPYEDVFMVHVPKQGREELGSDREIFSATALIDYKLNEYLSLTSITDYRDLFQAEAYDSDGTPLEFLQFGTRQKGKVFSQELRLNFDNQEKLRGFVGVNYFDERDSTRFRLAADEAVVQSLALAPQLVGLISQNDDPTIARQEFVGALTALGVPNAQNVFNPYNPVPVSLLGLLQLQQVIPLDDIVQEQYTEDKFDGLDIFADISYDLTDKLTLNAGVRYTDEEYTKTEYAYLVDGNDALGGAINGLTLTPTFVFNTDLLNRKHDADSDLTWRVAANYKLDDQLTTWASIARGRRPGGLTIDSNEATGIAVIDPEFLTNYEIGLKGEFLDNRLRLTTSAYYSEYEDFQVFFREAGNPLERVKNTGAATQYGFEIDAFMIANDYVDVFGTYGYNFSEFDDTDTNGVPHERAGNSFRISPENTFSVGAEVHIPFGDDLEAFAVPTYVWKDEFYFSDLNRPAELQDAYGLLDLKIGIRNESQGWSVSAYVENATDEEYLIDWGNTGDSFQIPTTIRGIPRWYGVKVKATF